ncbi:Phage integrase [Streptococcus sp. DD10]|uniref:site-specific integrase n=1 Tax=Streptococcus sp. DD10 TaxID=1777878 RepID=UPI000799970C|nr:tyrosine-type recombinase/integrase [Streptococcus sp. DD10]KXT72129.1 Phage integrase [Streptococcus sp. DD10]
MASYRKRDGSWEYRISYKTPDGKYKQKSKRGFRTKKEAELAAAQDEQRLTENFHIDTEITMADYFENWVGIHKQPHIAKGSLRSYQQTIRIIREYFKTTKLKTITSTIYQQFLNDLGERYYQATLSAIHHRVKRSIKQAVADGYILRNFTELSQVKAKQREKPLEDKFLELDTYLSLIETLKSDTSNRDYMHLYLLAVTGMRLGESLGLTWDDIDFKNSLINIDKTWDIYDNDGFRPTKNKQSVRKIPLDSTTALLLKKYKLAGWIANDHDRLFPRVNHSWLNKMVKELTGTNIHVHSLRHTYASYLISKDIDLLTVSNLLGHKDLTITLQTYTHQLEAKKEKEFEEIKKLFG